jgi:hypothetical protein
LLLNKEVRLDAKYLNPTSGLDEELTIEEYECLYTFQRWFKTVKPQILQNEIVVWGDGYAGTIDFVARINGELYIIDFKTGQSIWPSYELQLSAYKHAYEMENPMSVPKLAVLQLGYKRNKGGFKFTEIEDQYDLFVAAKRIWQKEHGNEAPSQKDYPLVLSLKEDEPTPAKRSIKNSKHQETNA